MVTRLNKFGWWLALAVCLMAISVLLVGWLLGVEPLRSIFPGYAAMVPSTAVSFMVAAITLIFSYQKSEADASDSASFIGPAFIMIVAVADLIVIAVTSSNGIDQFIFPMISMFASDSMAIATATSFLLVATCLLTLKDTSWSGRNIYVGTATLGVILASIALTGYAFDTNALYEVSLFTAMALHTAIAFFALFVSLLLRRSNIGWMAILVGDGSGSVSARRLVPGAIAVPFILCLIALVATDAGIVNTNFRLSVLAIAMMALLTATALKFASVQNQIEGQLHTTIADRELLLREVYHRVKNNLQMTTSLLRMGKDKAQEPQTRELLLATIKRVEAIGIVHRLLIAARIPSNVHATVFIKELCDNIVMGSLSEDGGVEIEADVGEFTLNIDAAVTIGLLLNELITNALKHAFPNGKTGKLRVYFRQETLDSVLLVVADDGIGLDVETGSKGSGTRIIEGLVRQLNAKMRILTDAGTAYQIDIPKETLQGDRDE